MAIDRVVRTARFRRRYHRAQQRKLLETTQRRIAALQAEILELDPNAFRPRTPAEAHADTLEYYRREHGDEGVQYVVAVMARLRKPAKPGEQRESPFVEMLCGPEAERLFGSESVQRTRESMRRTADHARRDVTRALLHQALRVKRQRSRGVVMRRPRGAGRPAGTRSLRRRGTASRDGPSDDGPAEPAPALRLAPLSHRSGDPPAFANRSCLRWGRSA